MIELPRRSVTRFFIPLIDVLTLLFCIFLLMPLVKAKGDDPEETPQPAGSLTALERQELEQLRRDKQELERLRAENKDMQRELEKLRQEKNTPLPQRLAIRVLEIGEEGRLFYYDPRRPRDRRIEITAQNVQEFLDAQRREAGVKELYLLILYPRRVNGFPGFPLQEQRREYDRWFEKVSHSYDIPYRTS